jgi:DNA-binding NtrC family response regulator
MRIDLPPLRAYKDNLEVLAHVFLQQAAERHGRAVGRLAPEAFALLRAYDFPGNVRELKNALEHAVILAEGDEVRVQDLPETMARGAAAAAAPAPSERPAAPAPPTLAEMRERWLAPLESAWLRELLAASGGSVRRAATAAGVDAVTLYRLLKKRGVAAGRAAR